MISSATLGFFMGEKMLNEKLICGDCKGFTTFKNKRGSGVVEVILWLTLFVPGIFYSFWRRSPVKKICQYCESDFLLPPEMTNTLK